MLMFPLIGNNFGHLAKVVSVSFIHQKVTIFPFCNQKSNVITIFPFCSLIDLWGRMNILFLIKLSPTTLNTHW